MKEKEVSKMAETTHLGRGWLLMPYRSRKLEEGVSLERKRKNLNAINGIFKLGLEAFVETGLVPRGEKAS